MKNKLSPEEIILWLEEYRRLMFEVWANNSNYKKILKSKGKLDLDLDLDELRKDRGEK